MNKYGLQCVWSLKEHFTNNNIFQDINTDFLKVKTNTDNLNNYDFSIENQSLKIKFKNTVSINSSVEKPFFIFFLKKDFIQLNNNEFLIVMKGRMDLGTYPKVYYNTITSSASLNDTENISSSVHDQLWGSGGGSFGSNVNFYSMKRFIHFSVLGKQNSSSSNFLQMPKLLYYPSTLNLSQLDFSSWGTAVSSISNDTTTSYLGLAYQFPFESNSLYTYIDDILFYIKPKNYSSEIRSHMIYDLYQGLNALYLPGELVENIENQITQFTNYGNLLINNDFIEAMPSAAYEDHFEAYELIEYGRNSENNLEQFPIPGENEIENEEENENNPIEYIDEAYAILTEDGDLIFFRSENTTYQNATNYTDVEDIEGNLYSGIIFKNIEKQGSGDAPWDSSSYRTLIKNAYTVGDQIITLSGNWIDFTNCSNMITCDLSNFNTSNVTSMHDMFRDCSSLTSLNISNFNTSKVTNMQTMFYNCSSLTSLNISNFNTSNVTTMYDMFYNCKSLTSLNLSNFNTSKVTNMASMFYNCENLTSLNVSNFNTSNVTNMQTMFRNCKSLTSLNVNHFDTSNVIYMSNMFTSCHNLTSLNVSNFNTSNVTYMNSMFSNCQNLTSLNLSNFNTSKVTNMAGMFTSCENLTSLNINSFDTSNVTYMNNMFSGCKNLTSLNVSNFNTSKVTDMYDMFYNCERLTSLNLSNFNTSNVTDMYDMFYNCSSLTSLNLSNFNTSKVTTMFGMFYNCKSLTSLDLSNFNTSNVTDMHRMFDDCTALTSLNVSSFNTSKVTNMQDMFEGCESLTSLNVSNFNTRNVTSMKNMFTACYNLTSLNLSNFNTSNVTDMSAMFFGCKSLTSLNVSNFNTSNVTSMFSMSTGCENLTSLDLSSFNTRNVTSMQSMFFGCKKLITIFVNSSRWTVANISSSSILFDFCYALVGQNGTTYDSSHVDKTYARIDTASTPGYLTAK